MRQVPRLGKWAAVVRKALRVLIARAHLGPAGAGMEGRMDLRIVAGDGFSWGSEGGPR
jgi:hypothetical protein